MRAPSERMLQQLTYTRHNVSRNVLSNVIAIDAQYYCVVLVTPPLDFGGHNDRARDVSLAQSLDDQEAAAARQSHPQDNEVGVL